MSLAANRPDLVILDVMTPGMDGIEVLQRIRADPQTALIPVIVYSGIPEPEFREQATRNGANAFWLKVKVDFAELEKLVQKYA